MSEEFDASTLSYDDFVLFFFTHPESDELWQFDGQGRDLTHVLGGNFERPSELVSHLTRLFLNIRLLADTLSVTALDHGLDGVLCGVFQLHSVLWNDTVPIEPRLECIRSMYHVFKDVVAKLPGDAEFGVGWMWWDHICWNFRFALEYYKKLPVGDYYHLLSPNDRALADCMFETILRVLAIGEGRCEYSALHGLGHLNHPRGRAVVENYINDHRASLTPDGLKWLESCRDGNVM
jgi:hypothetical protein